MASRSTLTQAIYEELVDVMDARDDTDAGNAHVVLRNEDLPDTPPALSIYFQETPTDNGPHATRVKALVENNDGAVVDVRYADDKELVVEVTCLAQTDQTAVSVYEAVRQHFNGFDRVRDPEDLADGVDEVICADASPQDGDDRRGHLLRIEVTYEETFLRSDIVGEEFTPVESVETTIEAGDGSQNQTTQ